MPLHSDYLYLCHMRDACLDIQQYVAGSKWESFAANKMMQDAVIYKLAIIGEASSKFSKDFTDSHNDFPWRDINPFFAPREFVFAH
jgi:uncharacterized protein with HEPN domain